MSCRVCLCMWYFRTKSYEKSRHPQATTHSIGHTLNASIIICFSNAHTHIALTRCTTPNLWQAHAQTPNVHQYKWLQRHLFINNKLPTICDTATLFQIFVFIFLLPFSFFVWISDALCLNSLFFFFFSQPLTKVGVMIFFVLHAHIHRNSKVYYIMD